MRLDSKLKLLRRCAYCGRRRLCFRFRDLWWCADSSCRGKYFKKRRGRLRQEGVCYRHASEDRRRQAEAGKSACAECLQEAREREKKRRAERSGASEADVSFWYRDSSPAPGFWPMSELHVKFLHESGAKLSREAFGRELKKLGLLPERLRVGGRRVYGYRILTDSEGE